MKILLLVTFVSVAVLSNLTGYCIGYWVGKRAGREPYNRIMTKWIDANGQ